MRQDMRRYLNDPIDLMIAERILQDADAMSDITDLWHDYADRYDMLFFPKRFVGNAVASFTKCGDLDQARADCATQLGAHLAGEFEKGWVLPVSRPNDELKWLVAEHVIQGVWNRIGSDELEYRPNAEDTNPYWYSFVAALGNDARHHAELVGFDAREFETWIINAMLTPTASYDHHEAKRGGGACIALQTLCEGMLDVAREHSRI